MAGYGVFAALANSRGGIVNPCPVRGVSCAATSSMATEAILVGTLIGDPASNRGRKPEDRAPASQRAGCQATSRTQTIWEKEREMMKTAALLRVIQLHYRPKSDDASRACRDCFHYFQQADGDEGKCFGTT